jgi:hypothetical protein
MVIKSGGGDRRAGSSVWIRYAGDAVAEVPAEQVRLRDFEGSVPWRVVRSRHGQAHLSGSHWAATTGGHVAYESRLELARLLLADFDVRIRGIYAQPCHVVARVGGRVRRHVPDYLLLTTDDTARVVNVKPAQRLADPQVAEALAWPGELFGRHGWEYEIWSGCDAVVLENVRFLAAYRRPGVVADEDIARAWESVCDGDQLAVAERRLAGEDPPHTARPALMALLWSGRLVTDLSRPLSGGSVLRRCR